MKLLSVDRDAKTSKGGKLGYLTGILYLNPIDFDLCPKATDGCKKSCLYNSGLSSVFPAIKEGRTRKTFLFLNNREQFKKDLRADLAALVRKAKREGNRPAVRLNGTSDLAFFKIARDEMRTFPDVQFYDYTKVLNYWHKAQGIPNYHVTFSASEDNQEEVLEVLDAGGQVAMVTDDKRITDHDGDAHDLTFLHGPGIIGLSPKGSAAKADTSGFVKRIEVINHA